MDTGNFEDILIFIHKLAATFTRETVLRNIVCRAVR